MVLRMDRKISEGRRKGRKKSTCVLCIREVIIDEEGGISLVEITMKITGKKKKEEEE